MWWSTVALFSSASLPLPFPPEPHTFLPHTFLCEHTRFFFRTRILYGIVSISDTAEGMAMRDWAGLSRRGPDFTGYKGSRLPLVSSSVLEKKIFVWKSADYHNRKIAAVQFRITTTWKKEKDKKNKDWTHHNIIKQFRNFVFRRFPRNACEFR